MSEKIYRDFDKVFLQIAQVLEEYSKSKILQDYFLSQFESLVYGNLINNFFINLNQKNIKEKNLPKGKIGKIKKRYRKIQKDVRLALSLSLKNKKINEKYYNNFKLKTKRNFSEFLIIFSEIEKEINIEELKIYLKKKENEIRKLGKSEKDLNAFILTKPLEIYIQKERDFPIGKKVEKLVQSIIQKILPEYSNELMKSLKRSSKEMLDQQRNLQKGFENRLYIRWEEPLDLLECLIRVSTESGEKQINKLSKTINDTNNFKLEAIKKIHVRALQISNEILVLLKSGYADGANSRWRSIHELAVISLFLLDNNNDVSQRYLEHAVIKNFKQAKDYRIYYRKLGYPPLERKAFNKLKKEKEKLCQKYQDRFQDDYGWIPSSILVVKNFRELEKHVKIDKLRPFYNLSCDAVHGGPKGFYRLGLMDHEQDKLLLIGSSSYGLADPIQNTAISLLHVTLCLLMLEIDFESLIQMHVMKNYVDEIGVRAIEVQEEMEKEESKLPSQKSLR